MLSFIYRLLTRARKRDEVTQDMIGTFEEARADAQSRGRWSYFLFSMRELAGLLRWRGRLLGSGGKTIPKTRWTLIAGTGLAGLVLGAVASFFLPASYTSEAVLMLTPSSIPDSLLPNLDALDLETAGFDGHGLDLLRQKVTSNRSLTKIIVDYNLYPHERSRRLFIGILQEMRKAIRIERSGDFGVRVAFTYDAYPPGALDAHKAQQVDAELVAELMYTKSRDQSNDLFQSKWYFSELSDDAAKSWDKLNSQMRGLTPADPGFDRLALDRELAQKEYESLRQRLGQVQKAGEIFDRNIGRKLQILDGASLPEGPEIPAVEMVFMALYGLGGGLALGIIASVLQTLRRAPSVLLPGEAAPSH